MKIHHGKATWIYSKKSTNFAQGNGEFLVAFFASPQQLEWLAEGFDFELHKKKFLEPNFINFSSPFKPAHTLKSN